MNIWGIPKERAKIFHNRDDGAFQYRELDIEDKAMIEKGANDKWNNAWPLIFKLEKDFAGYKAIKQGRVTITFNRDIILDPFKQLNDKEKPEQGRKLVKDFITAEAEAKCYKHEQAPQDSMIFNKAVYFAGAVMVILGLALGATSIYG